MTESTMTVPYLDLSVTDPLKARLLEAVDKVLTHGRVLLGPEVAELEQRVAAFCGVKYAVGVSCGTSALYLALRALGVGPGHEVVTTALSWVATANAIAMCGAAPVFVDIGEDQNLDPARLEAAITSRTRAIVPVHFTGRLCRMEAIAAVADRHGLPVVEDAAQAFGASRDGRLAGSFGRLGAFSLNPMKILRAYGEAGIIVTDDESARDFIRVLRYNGAVNRENCHHVSLNFRIDTMQAAMLLVNLDRIPAIIARRREIAAYYTSRLQDVTECPCSHSDEHIYFTYVIQTERRDALMRSLAADGIETKIQHPLLMPDHAAYRHLLRPDVPVARRVVRRILSLPNHEDLTQEQMEYIVSRVRAFFDSE